MKKSELGFGIVGTGMIAGIIADAIEKSANAKLIAVSGRRLDTAQAFSATRRGVSAVQGHDGLLTRADVDAVYIANSHGRQGGNRPRGDCGRQTCPC